MPSLRLSSSWDLEAQMEIGGDTWKNTICIKQVSGTADTPPAPTADIVEAWRDFLIAIHYPDVTINELTLRDIYGVVGFPDPAEHPPVWSLAVGTPGTGNTTWGGAHNANYLPQDVSVYAKKTTVGGRSGKQFFRNILTEVDVASPLGGSWAFSDGAGHWQTSVFNSTAASILGDYFENPPATGDYVFAVLHLAYLPSPTDVRVPFTTLATSMVAVRPTWNKAKR